MHKLLGTIIVSVVICFAQIASAGPLEDGMAAYERGDHVTALKLLLASAGEGSARAQNRLGVMYSKGQGVEPDYKVAQMWFNDALLQARKDEMESYIKQGATQDYKKAGEDWYRKAAKQGYAKAQFLLGINYTEGEGVVQDYKEALEWHHMAAEQGYADSQASIGIMYARGEGVTLNQKEAAKWFRTAALHGSADGMIILGEMYKDGRGVTRDYLRAHMWISLAGTAGDKGAGKARREITKRMTSTQVSQAQEMARKCKASNYKQCD